MQMETIKALLESGADPDKLNDIVPGFYERLATQGETRILDVLLDKCSQNFKDKLDAEGLLYFTANRKGPKNRECVKMLLEKGFNIDQRCPSNDNRAAIHAALINRDLELLNLLLSSGASLFTLGGSEGSVHLLPYVIAREMGYDDTIISRLIPEDINGSRDHPCTEILGMYEDMTLDIKGYSFLMYVCLAGGTPHAVKQLLNLGADPKQCNSEGFSAFQAAMMQRYYDIAEFLLPYTDLSVCHWKDTNQVQWALEQYIRVWWIDSEHEPHSELLEVLLEAGADPNKPNARGQYPLLLALEGAGKGQMKDESDVVTLFSYGADPNIVGPANGNALWWAAKSGYPPVLEAVLEENPDILLSDLKVEKDHWYSCPNTTAMQEALKTCNAEIVNLCVEAGFGLAGTLEYLNEDSNNISDDDEDIDPDWKKHLKPNVVERIKLYSNRPRRLDEIAKFSILRCIQGETWEVIKKAKSLPLAQPQIEYLTETAL